MNRQQPCTISSEEESRRRARGGKAESLSFLYDTESTWLKPTVGTLLMSSLLGPATILGGRYHYPHFTDGKTEAQRS